MADRITLTGLAPDGLITGLHDARRFGPFRADPQRTACVVDRDGDLVAAIAAPDLPPAVRGKLAELVAADLTRLEAEARMIRAPLDPDHLSAVQAASQHFRAQTRRDAAE